MSREDMITLINEFKEERETLIQEKECIISHTKEIESELTSIKVKIANRFLDKFSVMGSRLRRMSHLVEWTRR